MDLAEAFRRLGPRFRRANADDYMDELVQLVKDAADRHDIRSLNGSIGGICIGTGSAAKIKLANTVLALVMGTRVSLTSAEYAFTATDHDIAKSNQAIFVLSLDDTGAVTVTKGADHASAAVAPAVPDGEYALGQVKLVITGAAIFNASTDLLSDAHITDTYTDLLGWLADDLAMSQDIEIPSDVAC